MKHKGTVTLETERLILRRYSQDDAEDVFRNWAASEEVTRFLTWKPYNSADEVMGYIKYCIDCYEKPENYNWIIELKEIGQAVGGISVVWINDEIASCEIGYCLGKAFWGRGIMPEALNEVIRFFFEEVGVERVIACHHPDNPNSGRVMQKCGMTYAGKWAKEGKGVELCWYGIKKDAYFHS